MKIVCISVFEAELNIIRKLFLYVKSSVNIGHVRIWLLFSADDYQMYLRSKVKKLIVVFT